MRNISKKIFLKALTCRTRGWLLLSTQPAETQTLADKFQMEQGIEVGKRARDLYPGGVLVSGLDNVSAARRTEALVNDPSVSAIFEGAFISGVFVAKADILEREADGWRMVEVKSSVNDKKDFIDDMAYTTMVIKRSGLDVSGVSVLLISKDFRLGMDTSCLFVETDHTDEVLSKAEEFGTVCDGIAEALRESEKPAPEFVFECGKCEFFEDCMGKGLENPIYDIPRLSRSKFVQLAGMDVFCIEDIPGEFNLTDNQARVRASVQSGRAWVGDGLRDDLESILWPAYYLDFETVKTAIPLYPNVAPHAQVPTQYSIHKCSEVGRVVSHSEYLADPDRDCRRELAESLINDLGKTGSIIVYTSFEKGIINGLSKEYPDLSREFGLLIDRIVDLNAIISNNFYHPDFRGSTSIKQTLPVLVPEMSYSGLEISEGGSAMAAFAYMALGHYTGQRAEEVKRDLLEYCKQDTLAMVKLHERLLEYA